MPRTRRLMMTQSGAQGPLNSYSLTSDYRPRGEPASVIR